MTAERIEHLRARLLERDVQIEEVWDYLALQHQPTQGMVMQPLATFIDTPNLAAFWWLHDWWAPVANKPNTLPTPTISQFCWFINHTPGSAPVTFDDALQQTYQRALKHCQANDLDPANPGETADDRRRRRNRERMAKVRGHRQVPQAMLKGNEALSAQVRGLEAQAEMLKQQAAEEEARLREDVLGYQKRMLDTSDERKRVAADFKLRIDNIRTEIRSLIAKQ